MKIEEAKQTMYALACTHYGKEFYEKENEAIKIACKSLEAWGKVKEDLRKFIDANSNSGDMYLEGRADGGWHALATIKRCLAEVENDIQEGNRER